MSPQEEIRDEMRGCGLKEDHGQVRWVEEGGGHGGRTRDGEEFR